MKSAYKILTLSCCVLLFLTACQNAGKQEKITTNEQKQASAEVINNTIETNNKTPDENYKIQKENNKTIIPITVNLDNGKLKKAYVDKDKLVEYINSSDGHEFYYEDFKAKVGLAFDGLFDNAEEFKTSSKIAKVKNVKYVNDSYKPDVFIINKKGEKLLDCKNFSNTDIINENYVICEKEKKVGEDYISEFYLFDNKGNKMKDLGEHSRFCTDYLDKNIIVFIKSYFINNYSDIEKKYAFYDLEKQDFVEAPENFNKETFDYFSDENTFINSSFYIKEIIETDAYFNDISIVCTKSKDKEDNSTKAVELINPRVEQNYLVGRVPNQTYVAVYDENLNLLFDKKFIDFYYIKDNYYAGSKYYEDLETSDFYYHQAGRYTRDYRQNTIYDGKNFTDFEYFMIDYIGDDVFYVFDGEKFKFVNMKTKKELYEHVDTRFNINKFFNYNDLIIGIANNDIEMLITDKNYMITKAHYKKDKIEAVSEIKNRNFSLNTYPRFILENKDVEKTLNDNIIKIFKLEYDEAENKFYNDNKTAITNFTDENFYLAFKNDYALISIHNYFQGFGVHPYNSLTYKVFDIKTGELVTEENIFKDSEEAQDFILQELTNQTNSEYKGIFAYYDLKNGETPYDVFLGEYRDSFNFTFTDEGMFILYNQYDLACYDAGRITYTIPYEAIKPYLKNEVIRGLGI